MGWAWTTVAMVGWMQSRWMHSSRYMCVDSRSTSGQTFLKKLQAGHKMKDLTHPNLYWLNMNKDIVEVTWNCQQCIEET